MTQCATVFANGGNGDGHTSGFRTRFGALLGLALLAAAAAADEFAAGFVSGPQVDDGPTDPPAPQAWIRPDDGDFADAYAAAVGAPPLTGPDGAPVDLTAFRWSDTAPAQPANPDGSTIGAWIPADAWPWTPPQDGQDGPQDAPDGDGPNT